MGLRLRLLFHFSSSSALQLIVRSFVRSQHSFLSSNIHYLLFHDRSLSSSHHMKIKLSLAIVRCHARTSIEIDESVFLESLLGDIGAFAWSMVIDWSIFWNMVR